IKLPPELARHGAPPEACLGPVHPWSSTRSLLLDTHAAIPIRSRYHTTPLHASVRPSVSCGHRSCSGRCCPPWSAYPARPTISPLDSMTCALKAAREGQRSAYTTDKHGPYVAVAPSGGEPNHTLFLPLVARILPLVASGS